MVRMKGFTLIELLIVVAIIAILAAIAVPNFLQAQTRAKVSRVKADMRSVTIAIESYATEWNQPPFGWREHSSITPWGLQTGFNLDRYIANRCALSHLTTPVDYMSSIPNDPFQEKYMKKFDFFDDVIGPHPFNYDTYFGKYAFMRANFLKASLLGYTWSLNSPGPSLKDSSPVQILVGEVTNLFGGERSDASYDPSNGAVSPGIIMRTNKGFFEGSGAK